MVLKGSFPPDIRVKREATHLIKNGHNVTLVATGPSDRPKREVIDGIEVRRVRDPSSTLSYAMRELFGHLTLVYPGIYQMIALVDQGQDIDVLHAHDLPILRTVALAGRKTDTPVIADLHEIYPKSLQAWRIAYSLTDKLRPGALFRPSIRYSLLERRLLPRIDGVVTVAELAREYYINRYNLDPNRVEVVQNVIDLERFDSYPIKDLDIEGEFVISYIGNFTPERNLEPLIQSMDHITEEIPTVKLIMVGDSSGDYIELLKNKVERLDLSQNVIFTGWVDFEEVPSYFHASDITGSAVGKSGIGSEIALPNKLFQSMAASTPLIVNNTQSTADIISKTGCGVVVDPYTAENIASTILSLYKNKSKHEEMGQLGRKAVENRYNIRKEIINLENIYTKVIS